MPIVQQGSINTTALVVPDLYVQIVPPQNLVLNGVPTNVIGVVGSASWGPVNEPTIVGSMADYARAFGAISARKYDMGTHVAAAVQQGASNFRCVRVTDGSAVAAAFQWPSTSFVLTAKYSGSLGNSIVVGIAAGSQASSWRFTAAIPGLAPEVFDNITYGVVSNTLTAPGSAYTNPPAIAWPVPSLPGGRRATGSTSLKVVTATVAAGGTGHVVGNVITLQSGVTVTVATLSGSAVATVTITDAGYIGPGGGAPTNPTAQVSSTGPGTGATFNLSWGVNSIDMTDYGTGYTGSEGAPTFASGAATATTVYSVWINLLNAINVGTGLLRGPSRIVVASGTGTVAAAAGSFQFGSGTVGTDGAASVTAATLVGVDTVPRTGMYALRGQGCTIGDLADADDSTQWTVQAAFGLSEGIYMILTGPAGDTIANAVSVKASAGLDSYACKLMFGDWIYWNDPVNSAIRLVSPQGFVAGRLANLSPEQSSLNKPLYGVVGSQKSGAPGAGLAGVYSAAEMQVLFQKGIDLIANPQPGGAFWGVRLGHNSASAAEVSGDNYTRMTNYIAATLNAGMGRYVGRLINQQLFQQVKATMLDFLRAMQQQGMLATGIDGTIPFSVICDLSNNPNNRTMLGYVQADVQVRYQAINEKFIVNLEGGQTVQVSRQTTPAGQAAA